VAVDVLMVNERGVMCFVSETGPMPIILWPFWPPTPTSSRWWRGLSHRETTSPSRTLLTKASAGRFDMSVDT